jgi:Helix-loop-helix DNA-binding domain
METSRETSEPFDLFSSSDHDGVMATDITADPFASGQDHMDSIDMALDHMFPTFESLAPYHDSDSDFFHLFDSATDLSLAAPTIVPTIDQTSQQSFPPTDIASYPPTSSKTHPSMAIPTYINPAVPIQPGPKPPMRSNSRPLILPRNGRTATSQFGVDTSGPGSPAVDAFSFGITPLQQAHGPVQSLKGSGRRTSWPPFDSMLEDFIASPNSEPTPTSHQDLPPSKPTKSRDRNIAMASRKGSGSGSSLTEFNWSKTSHNMIEKRYRLKLNDKFMELKNVVPSIRDVIATDDEDDRAHPKIKKSAPVKMNKGTILIKAVEYIKELEREMCDLKRDKRDLERELDVYRFVDTKSPKQDFEWGGVAPKTEDDKFVVASNGMISPLSCTSEMSPAPA